ncbi:hypothetical protein, partial [Sphingobium limneticum]|uniref:hypothetical protein n=1 Tax=Sphingobium limneticum TaxID=1007511 RepID=UPI001B882C84
TTSGHFGLIRGTTYFDVSSHSVIINDQNEAQCCAAANFWLRKRQSHGPGAIPGGYSGRRSAGQRTSHSNITPLFEDGAAAIFAEYHIDEHHTLCPVSC